MIDQKNRFLMLVAGLILALLPAVDCVAAAPVYTVHAAPLGNYMITVGPRLEASTGLTLEILSGALRHARMHAQMARVSPWHRAQVEAMDEPGAILPVLVKTPARLASWRWLTPVYTDRVYGFTLPGHPVYPGMKAIAASQPHIGVVLGSASESIMKGRGVEVDASPDLKRNLAKLLKGRLDVLLLQGMLASPAFEALMQSPRPDPLLPRLQRTVLMEVPIWVVVSRKTPEADAERLKNALESFKRTAEYRAIVKKYESRIAWSARAG
jgi:hypothetical protein